MKKVVALIGMALLSFPAVASETIDVEYKSFYSHLRKLTGDDVQGLQFAFGFKHVTTQQLCHLEAVQIVTQKVTLPVEVSKENRFTLPYEKALNLADALVNITMTEPTNQCDMSVQLETKPEHLKAKYSAEDLAFIYSQYESFFNEMGSFLSFLMPSVSGLMLQFDDPELDYVLGDGLQITNGVLMLSKDWLAQDKPLKLPHKPLRVTALTGKS